MYPRARPQKAHARRSESAKGIAAMLTCALSTKDRALYHAAKLDQAPVSTEPLEWHAGFENVPTPRASTRRPHHEAGATVKYNAAGRMSTLHAFYSPDHGRRARRPLTRAAGLERSDRLVGYLQKCFGYSLTGDVSGKGGVLLLRCRHSPLRQHNGKTARYSKLSASFWQSIPHRCLLTAL